VDTNNNFAASRFTATVPGKYLLTAQLAYNNGSAIDGVVVIYKNGSHLVWGDRATSALNSLNVTTIVNAVPGDYFEVYSFTALSMTTVADQARTFFAGALLAPQGGSGGGTANPAGSTGDIQFNTGGALAADTGQLFWDATSNRLGIGSSAPGYTLDVTSTVDTIARFSRPLATSTTAAPPPPATQA
jgi:hypothetical protein